ncbi:MAG: radical SAM protein [Nitrospirae bacterium]|nr:radical SAM protein [Nitrospirota bacterium]
METKPSDGTKYYLSERCFLKRLETPCVYDAGKDELYELDSAAFDFLKQAGGCGVGARDGDSAFVSYCVEEGLITTTPVLVARPPDNQSPIPSLRYLELQLTAACNLKCRHCFVGDSRAVHLPLDTVVRVLKDFEAMQGLRLLLTGGEPLMYPDFAGLNRRLPEFALRKILLTNGVLLTDELLKCLNVDEIQISIDGLAAGHDAVRGEGQYNKAIQAVKRAQEVGFDVSVATTIHSENMGEFAAMEEMFINMNIKDWTVDVPVPKGSLLRNKSLCLPPESVGKLLSYGFSHGGGIHCGSDEGGWACGAHLMSISADGVASKCLYYADTPAGTAEDGLQHCWGRIEPLPLSKLKCDCAEIETCRGGCRYRAAALGDPFGKDLFKCHSILY